MSQTLSEPAKASDPKYRTYLARLIMLIPVGALVLQAVTWVQYGVDVPAFDDWRQYVRGWAGSFDLSDLFVASNGSVTAVGRLLDSLVYVTLGGNVVVYELLSMVAILSAILFLQWRLLQQTLRDALVVAGVFLLTMLSLRVGTLWGHATMAFQQALPIVLILTCLWLVLRPRPLGRMAMAVVVTFGVIAGLTYISGAFAVTAVAMVLLVASVFASADERTRLRRGGVALLAAGVPTLAIQLLLVFGVGTVHDAVASTGFSMPWDPRFWAFLLGLVGGSLWPALFVISEREVVINLAATLVALGLLGVTVVWAFRVLFRPARATRGAITCALVLLSLTAASVVYLGLAAAARASGDLPADAPLLDVFSSGRPVHRPFWMTLVWPWVGAALVLMLGGVTWFRRRYTLVIATAIVVPMLAVVAIGSRGTFDYGRWYANAQTYRLDVLQCLVARLDAGEPLHCQRGAEFAPDDLTDPVLEAMATGASFTQYLRPAPAHPSVPTIFELSAGNGDTLRVADTSAVEPTDSGYLITGADATRLRIETGLTDQFAACKLLEVKVEIGSELAAWTALFWSKADAPGTEIPVKPFVAVNEPAASTLYFFMPSVTGFADAFTLWIAKPPADLGEVQVRCRMPTVQDPPSAAAG